MLQRASNYTEQKATQGGEVVLGSNSRLEAGVESITESEVKALAAKQFVPDPSESEAVQKSRLTALEDLIRKQYTVTATDTFKASQVKIDGRTVLMQSGSSVVAQGGTVEVSAAGKRTYTDLVTTEQKSAETFFTTTEADAGARVVMAKDAVIDVSGYKDVQVDGDKRNQVSATLVSNELKDAPLQRGGVLYRQTVQYNLLDAPTGKFAVADTSGVVASRATSLQERAATGGAVSFQSAGDVVLGSGSKVDVSGGAVQVSGATIATTQLLMGNKRVDITKASADVVYDGVTTTERYVAAYTEGKNAGSASISARGHTVLDGELVAKTQAGTYQNTPATAPKGGTFIFGTSSSLVPQLDLRIGSGASTLDPDFWKDALKSVVSSDSYNRVSANALSAGGFQSVTLYGQNVTVEAGSPVALSAGSNLTLRAVGGDVDIKEDIRGAGLTFDAQADTSGSAGGSVRLAAGKRIDVTGLWINDYDSARNGAGVFAGTQQLDGGSIRLVAAKAGSLQLGEGSSLDVSGGAKLGTNGAVSLGNAGSIALSGSNVSLDKASLRGEAMAYGTSRGKGGSLSISAAGIRINEAAVNTADLVLDTKLFSDAGFSKFSLTATQFNAGIGAGTQLDLTRNVRMLEGGFRSVATGASVGKVAASKKLDSNLKDGASFSLSASYVAPETLKDGVTDRGVVTVGDGASINAGAGGSISLSARRQLTLGGELKAQGGSVSLTMVKPENANDDPGLVADQAIFLKDSARIDVSGKALVTTNAAGLRQGEVLDGGSVSIDAQKGAIVAKQGAQINLDGTAATLDNVTTRTTFNVASNAGSLNLSASSGLAFGAQTSAKGGGANAAGGSFSVTLSETSGDYEAGKAARTLTVGENLLQPGSSLATQLQAATPGASLNTLFDGKPQGWVDAASLRTAGFDKLALKSSDTLRFVGNVALSAAREVSLSGKIDVSAADVKINTSHASIGWLGKNDSKKVADFNFTPVAGNGSFTVNAGLIDLFGGTEISGAAKTALNSTGDIRLSGTYRDTSGSGIELDTRYNHGNFAVAGDVAITAAQMYATTLSNFTFSVAPGGGGTGGTLSIHGTGSTPQVPMSAGSRLAIEADTINQGGVLRAPFGSIDLSARKALNLKDGSLTSASGEGATIPFGTLVNGTDWTVETAYGQRVITSAPTPSVAFRGPTVEQSSKAKVDVSGGGDLQALEFVAGSGGSTNVLAQTNTYAIIPGYSSAYAPADAGFDRQAGTQITLGASAGVPAGTYTLLPARYAMLPGAYKVTLVNGYQDAASNLQINQALGGSVVSARLSVAGTGVSDSRSMGVLVEPREVTQKRSEFTDARASTFFAQQAAKNGTTLQQATQDGGQLIVAATDSIKLGGIIAMEGIKDEDGKKRRNGMLDISLLASTLGADGKPTGDIVVGSSTTTPASGVKTLTVSEADIAKIGAESIVVGGERKVGSSGSTLTVTARDVRYNGSAGLADAAGNKPAEVILAATNKLTVEAGSVIETAAADANRPAMRNTTVTGDGALLRVAADNNVVTRTGAKGEQGTLIVQDNVQLKGASVQADATLDSQLAKNSAATAAAFTLGAKALTLGGSGSTTEGTRLTDSLLSSVAGSADKLTLRSYGGIAFDESFSLGSTTPVKQLTLDAASLEWKGASAGSVQITGTQLTLTNTTGNTATATTGSGSLQLNAVGSSAAGSDAGTLKIGSGSMALRGFGDTTLNASRGVVMAGTGTTSATGPLTVSAPVVTVESGARKTLKTDGALTLASSGTGSDALPAGAGGTLVLEGSTATVATQLVSRSGAIGVKATSGDVTVKTTGSIDVSSRETNFDGSTQATNAGSIVLESGAGNVVTETGSVLDLRGRGTADAGSLTLNAAKGTVQLAGSLLASASDEGKAAGALGGKLSVDVGSLASLDDLVKKTTSFEEQWQLRLRQGDLQLSAGNTLKAHNIGLYADAGNIRIGGTLDASGPSGGRIDLAARRALVGGVQQGGQIVLEKSAVLDARASSAGGRGGDVTLSVSGDDAANTEIKFEKGSLIDVRGNGSGADGSVTLNVPRTTNVEAYSPVVGAAAVVDEDSVFTTPVTVTTMALIPAAAAVAGSLFKATGSTSLLAATDASITNASSSWADQSVTIEFVSFLASNSLANAKFALVTGSGETVSLNIKRDSSGANVSAGDIRPGGSYRLVYRTSSGGPYWRLMDSVTPVGTGLPGLGSLTMIPVMSSPGFTGAVGDVVYFTPSTDNFGGKTANANTGGVKLKTALGVSKVYVKTVSEEGAASYNPLAAGDLSAGTSYAAEYRSDGSFVLLSQTKAHETIRVTSASISGTPDSGVGIRFTPVSTNTSSTVELQLNNLQAGRLFAADGVTPVAVGSLAAGTTYTASRLPDGSGYALRPNNYGQVAVSKTGSVSQLAFSVSDTSAWFTDGDTTKPKVNSLKLLLSSGGTEVTLTLLDANGVAMTPAALVAGKTYVANQQTDGSYRLVDESAWANAVPVVNTGVVLAGTPTVTLNAFKTYDVSVVDAAVLGKAQADNKAFENWLPVIQSGLGSLNNGKLSVRPGVEFRSAGNMTLSSDINLAASAGGTASWRYSGDVAGSLVLRAGGALQLNGSINDGFASATDAMPTDKKNGWSVGLVAGSDLNAANAYSVTQGTGKDLVVTKLVRTGTGDIRLAAGGSIDLSSATATVYSGGRRAGSTDGDMALATTGTAPPKAWLAQDGGSVRFDAGGDVIGRAISNSPTDWLWRANVANGGSVKNAATAVRHDYFNWTLGALGGGDVSVTAGGSVRDLSVALPRQSRFVFGADGKASGVTALTHGNLSVQAGEDIRGGSYLVEQGTATLSAAGAVTAGSSGIRLYAADTHIAVNAGAELTIGSVQNAAALKQSVNNTVLSTGYTAAWLDYSANSSLALKSAAGSVTLDGGGKQVDKSNETGTMLPASVKTVALGGDVSLGTSDNELRVFPAAKGQLEVFAEGNASLANVSMVDANPAQLPSAVKPATTAVNMSDALGRIATTFSDNGETRYGARNTSSTLNGSLHDGDNQSAKIVARTGDVTGRVIIAKPVEVSAGRDVLNLSLIAQNMVATDVTSVSAGRDIRYTMNDWSGYASGNLPTTAQAAITVFGPGLLEVTSGRSIELANSAGIVSKGPGVNSYLPDTGASIRVVAGKPSSIDAAKFAATYLDASSAPAFLALGKDEQIAYATKLLRERFITTYLVADSAYLAQWQAYAAERGLSADLTAPNAAQQRAFDRFRYQVLWAELSASGRDGSAIAADAKAHPGKYSAADLTPEKLYGRGYKALDLMALGDSFGFNSSVRMLFSQIRTQSGGNVDVLVPGGSLDVGPTQAMAGFPQEFSPTSDTAAVKLAREKFKTWNSKLGLVANQGDSHVFARDAINVNTSRWFAIDGGDLLGWTNYGDIDAGKGARSAVSGASQRLDIDKLTGKVTLVDGGASSGSGIATIFNKPITTGGAVGLYATRGAVDAGEAGIRAAGNLTLTAMVRGADFILAVGTGGGATAAPAAPVIATPAATNSSDNKSATEAGAAASEKPRERSAILTVEVVAADDEAPAAGKAECGNTAGKEKSAACSGDGKAR
ncbi:MAG: filamentous hemagglutinin family protein [Rhodocyclaceae bacterium]